MKKLTGIALLLLIIVCSLLLGCGLDAPKTIGPGEEKVYQEYDGLKLKILEATADTIRYKVIYEKNNKQEAGVSPYPTIEVYQDGWKKLAYLWEDVGFLDGIIGLPSETEKEFSYDIAGYHGKLKPGKYRLVLFAMTGERYTVYLAEEFDVGG